MPIIRFFARAAHRFTQFIDTDQRRPSFHKRRFENGFALFFRRQTIEEIPLLDVVNRGANGSLVAHHVAIDNGKLRFCLGLLVVAEHRQYRHLIAIRPIARRFRTRLFAPKIFELLESRRFHIRRNDPFAFRYIVGPRYAPLIPFNFLKYIFDAIVDAMSIELHDLRKCIHLVFWFEKLS